MADGGDVPEAAVHHLVLVGLPIDGELVPLPIPGHDIDRTRPMLRRYGPATLRRVPEVALAGSSASVDVDALPTLCFPSGIRLAASAGDCARIHSFVVTRDDGTTFYGASLTYLEEITDTHLITTIRSLEAMHAQQQIYEMSPPRSRSAEEDADAHSILCAAEETSRQPLYAEQALAIISPIDAVGWFEVILRQLHVLRSTRNYTDFQTLAQTILTKVPIPLPGWSITVTDDHVDGWIAQLQCPTHQQLPRLEYSLRRLFTMLPLPVLFKLFTCTVLEQQILLLSKDPEKLMLTAQSLTALLYPFAWQSACVPILPASAIEYLEAPFAFIMGADADWGELETGQVDCIVNVDQGTVIRAPDDLPPCPFFDSLAEPLADMWQQEFERRAASGAGDTLSADSDAPENARNALPGRHNNPLNDASDLAFAHAVREHFAQAFASIFYDMEMYITAPEEDDSTGDQQSRHDHTCSDGMFAFDKMAFLSDQPRKYLNFYLIFLETQIFTTFMDDDGFGRATSHTGRSLAYFKRLCLQQRQKDQCFSPGFDIEDRGVDVPVLPRTHKLEFVVPVVSGKTYSFEEEHVDMSKFGASVLTLFAQISSRVSEVGTTPIMEYTALIGCDCDSEHGGTGTSRNTSRRESGASASSTDNISLVTPNRRATAAAASRSTSKLLQRLGPRGSDVALHENFYSSLLSECSTRVKKCVLAAIGTDQADSLGHEAAASADSAITAVCELLERVCRHGFRFANASRSSLWLFVSRAARAMASSGRYDIRKNASAIAEMDFLKTDIGRARAWVRLCIEQKTLTKEIQLLVSAKAMMSKLFKERAFLLQKDCVVQLLSHLMLLTTVDLHPFASGYPSLDITYSVIIRTAKGSKCGAPADALLTVHGSLQSSAVMVLARASGGIASGGEHHLEFTHKNLGEVKAAELALAMSPASTGWTITEVTVTNMLTGTVMTATGVRRVESRKGSLRVPFGTMVNAANTGDADPFAAGGSVTSSRAVSQESKLEHNALCEATATAVNSILRAFHHSSGTTLPLELRAALLLGRTRFNTSLSLEAFGADAITEGGLCRALLRVLSSGFRCGRVSKRHPWDFIAKTADALQVNKKNRRVSGSSGSGGGWERAKTAVLSSDPNSLLYRTVQRANSGGIAKSVRFEFFVCAGAHHHVLHVWFDRLVAAAADSKFYDADALLRTPDRTSQLAEMLRYLISFPFNLIGQLLYARYQGGSVWEVRPDPKELPPHPAATAVTAAMTSGRTGL